MHVLIRREPCTRTRDVVPCEALGVSAVGKCGHNLLIYIRGLGAIHAIIERHVRSHAVGDGGDTRSHANDINDSEP